MKSLSFKEQGHLTQDEVTENLPSGLKQNKKISTQYTETWVIKTLNIKLFWCKLISSRRLPTGACFSFSILSFSF